MIRLTRNLLRLFVIGWTLARHDALLLGDLRDQLGLGAHFDEIVYSAMLGVCKPDRVFFTNAQARMGVTAAQSILITDHAAREILQIVDHCYVIAEGQVMVHGSSEEVRNNKDVKRKYLGEERPGEGAAA